MAVEQHSDAKIPEKRRRRWWLWSLTALVAVLAIPVIYKWWWRTTTAWKTESYAVADQGRYEDAIAILNRTMWLSPDPDDRNGSYGIRAGFHAKMGNLDEAIEDMNLAVTWGQEQGDRLVVRDVVVRGIYKLEAGRPDDAVSDFDLTLQLVDRQDEVWRQRMSHFSAMAHYYRALANQQAGRDTDAEQDFLASRELDPEWFATVSGTAPTPTD